MLHVTWRVTELSIDHWNFAGDRVRSDRADATVTKEGRNTIVHAGLVRGIELGARVGKPEALQPSEIHKSDLARPGGTTLLRFIVKNI